MTASPSDAEWPIAEYLCRKCDAKWTLPDPTPHDCPHCGHVYVKWVNYEQWRAEWHRQKPEMKKH